MTDRWDTRTDNLGGRNGAPKRTYGDLCLVSPDDIYLRLYSIALTAMISSVRVLIA